MGYARMKKAVVFDMDGTLLPVNSWEELHRAYGLEVAEDQLMLRWYREGILDYASWTDLITRIYLFRGKATQKNAVEAFNRCVLDPSAKYVVNEIQRRGMKIFLLSGGILQLVARVAQQLKISRFAGNHDMKFDSDGRFLGFEICGDEHDFKVVQLVSFCSEHDLAPTDCLCVGDGCNDSGIFELTEHGILFSPTGCPPPGLTFWKKVTRLQDLIALLTV